LLWREEKSAESLRETDAFSGNRELRSRTKAASFTWEFVLMWVMRPADEKRAHTHYHQLFSRGQNNCFFCFYIHMTFSKN